MTDISPSRGSARLDNSPPGMHDGPRGHPPERLDTMPELDQFFFHQTPVSRKAFLSVLPSEVAWAVVHVLRRTLAPTRCTLSETGYVLITSEGKTLLSAQTN